MPTKFVDHTPYLLQMQTVNVKDFNAAVDGATDDTTAITNAIAALPAAGGTVYLPEGTICTSSAIKIPANVTIQGAGRGATIVKPLAGGSKADVFITNIPGSSGGAGGQTSRAAIRDLKIDLTNVTGGTAGAGNGIHFYGANYCAIERVWVYNGSEWGIVLEADSTNTGANNIIRDCLIDTCAGGILQCASDTDLLLDNTTITGAGTAAADNQGKFAPADTTVYQLRILGGYSEIRACTFGSAGTSTSQAVNIAVANTCRFSGNYFNQTRYAAINIASSSGGHTFVNNQFTSCSAVGTTGVVTVSASNNLFIGNTFDAEQAAAHFTYCVIDNAAVANMYTNNYLVTGTSGFFNQNAASTNQIRGNPGLNPVGTVTPPTFPLTTAAVTNNTGYDVQVYIANGTSAITALSIAPANGGTYTATGFQIAASGWGSFHLCSGESFKVTYAGGSPAYTWMAE